LVVRSVGSEGGNVTANNITYAELNNPSRAKPRCCAFECPLTGEMGGIRERRFWAGWRLSEDGRAADLGDDSFQFPIVV
jgi:hypothetical protein